MFGNLDDDDKPLMKVLFPDEEEDNNPSGTKEEILFKIGNINVDMDQPKPESKENTEEKQIEEKEQIIKEEQPKLTENEEIKKEKE